MNKTVKKVLKITGISIAAIFVLLLILPFAFKGKIIKIVKEEANKSLNAKIDFSNLSLSLIRNFPNASVRLDNLSIIGINEFANDTLIAAKEISATVDVMSLLGGGSFDIKRINLDQLRASLLVNADGKANWDIVKPTPAEPQKPEDTAASAFKLSLQKVTISNTYIRYQDVPMDLLTVVDNLNVTLKGDMTADVTNIETLLDIAALTVKMEGVPYFNKAHVKLDCKLAADLVKYKFTLKENQLTINSLLVNFDGWLALLDNGFDMDMKVGAPKTEFKHVLSLIPAVYAKDFEGIKTNGTFTLEGFAKGLMVGDTMPAFGIKFNVPQASFQYPALPKSVNNIKINLDVHSPGGDLDNTVVNLSQFHFEMAQNPFDMQLYLKRPMSDPDIDLKAKGHIDLGMVKEIYPLDAGMSLNGSLDADIAIKTILSMIEKEQYDKVQAQGDLLLKNIALTSPDVPGGKVDLSQVHLNFTPAYVNLSALDAKIGKNDIHATGKLENFLAYIFKDGTVAGNLNLNSNYLNVNDFMTESSTTAPTTDTAAMGVIEIPKNIHFNVNADLKKVVYDNMDIDNLKGNIEVKDGILDMKNLSLNALGGGMKVSGTYNPTDIKRPKADLKVNLQNVSFVQTFKTFVTIQKLAPIFEKADGNFSCDLALNTLLDGNMMPDLTSILANGSLKTAQVKLQNVTVLDRIAEVTKIKQLQNTTLKDLLVMFEIKDGRILTKPINIPMGEMKSQLTGSAGLNQTLDYTWNMTVPKTGAYAESANMLASKIGMQSSPLNNLYVKIGGTFTKPVISLDLKNQAKDVLDAVKDAAKEQAIQKVDEAKAKAVAEARAQADKLVAEAQKQADALKANAKKAGDQAIAEGEKQAQALVDQAKNPLAKAAAQKSAEFAKKEAQKKAQSLYDEADKKGNDLISKAKQQGDKMISDAENKEVIKR